MSDDGIKVYFGGQLVYQGLGTNPWQTFNFTVVGGSGDGSNKLEFVATGTNLNTYGAALDDVHFVKIADAATPPENHAPDAVDGTAEGTNDKVITGKLTATDPDGDAPLTFVVKDAAAHGTVVINADGTYTYTANAGYTGTDTFTFTVSDGHGGTDVATEHLTIKAPPPSENPNLIVNGSFEDLSMVNDQATWGYRNDKPAAILGWTDTNTTSTKKIEMHGPHSQDTTNNPVDAQDGKYYVDTVGSSNGANNKLTQTVQGVEAGRTYKLTFYIADGDKSHSDQGMNVYWGGKLVYSTSPGFDPKTGTIAAGSPAGQATPPAGQTWQEITVYVTGGDIANGGVANQLIFQGTGNASGNNGAELDNVSLRLVNTAPVTVNDTLPDVTANGQSIDISVADLLANDTDVDHDQLAITGVGSAVGGTVTMDQNGIHFTPASGFTGEASFQYTVSDGQGGTEHCGSHLRGEARQLGRHDRGGSDPDNRDCGDRLDARYRRRHAPADVGAAGYRRLRHACGRLHGQNRCSGHRPDREQRRCDPYQERLRQWPCHH